MLKSFDAAWKELMKNVQTSLSSVDTKQIDKMIDMMIEAKDRRILIMGVGRSGLIGKAFAMRLMHLGFDVYVMGETITPSIGLGDLIIVISGSGTTKLVVTAASIAKEVKAKIIAVTSYPWSELGRIADHIVQVKGRTKIAEERDYFTRQITGVHEPLAPLGTVFEMACTVFLDSLIVEFMFRLGKTEKEMESRHATIE